MAFSSSSRGNERGLADPSKPFKGVVICCTSIPPDLRAEISSKTVELGGVHKADLTPDATHLLVGDYNTAKYRHVARERPDVVAMSPGWVDAVMDLWTRDAAIDLAALEEEWRLKTFETDGGEADLDTGELGERGRLSCCLTGFEDADERQRIIKTITSNGGRYMGDLTKRISHLVVQRPEGRKYAAAKSWGLTVVSVEWVYDSAARGLMLDETKYDPTLPREERGKGAIIQREIKKRDSLGKRPWDNAPAAQDEGRKKLRKTASLKLNSQRDNLWGDILGSKPADPGASAGAVQVQDTPVEGPTAPVPVAPVDLGPFASCAFYIHGFSKARVEILAPTIMSLGGAVCQTLDELGNLNPSGCKARLAIVPQAAPANARPLMPEGVEEVTEFFIEKCLHKKQFYEPSTHVLGRPFPVFPIPDFDKLTVCTGGFTGVDLNQVDRGIRQLGAKYEERFTAQISILLVPSLDVVRQQKLDMAVRWNVPVVDARWLWDCITAGSKLAIKGYLFPGLKQSLDADKVDGNSEPQATALLPSRSEPLLLDSGMTQPTQPATARALPSQAPSPAPRTVIAEDSTTTHFETAPTHQTASKTSSGSHSAPLSAVSASELNRSPSPKKQTTPQAKPRQPLSRVVSEVADSEAPSETPDDEEEESFSNALARVAKEKIAAAERLALTKRLATLLETGSGPGDARSSAHDASGANSAVPAAAASNKPSRRRRGITGRAVSNVSAASTGSGSNETTAVARAAATTFTAGEHQFSLVGGGEEEKAAATQPPPATQLDYEEDPNAERYKAELMSKLMGQKAPPAAVAARRRDEEKITLRDVSKANAAVAATTGRRAMRRR